MRAYALCLVAIVAATMECSSGAIAQDVASEAQINAAYCYGALAAESDSSRWRSGMPLMGLPGIALDRYLRFLQVTGVMGEAVTDGTYPVVSAATRGLTDGHACVDNGSQVACRRVVGCLDPNSILPFPY